MRRSLCERVTLREELVGRFRVGSRLPQYLDCVLAKELVHGTSPSCEGTYLTTAMLTGAVVLAL